MPCVHLLGTAPDRPLTLSLEALARLRSCRAVVMDRKAAQALADWLGPRQAVVRLDDDDEEAVVAACLRRLERGEDVAYVANGNPFLFSGIGRKLADAARAGGFLLRSVPMPSALDSLMCALGGSFDERRGMLIATPSSLRAGAPLDARIPAFLLCVDGALRSGRLARDLQRRLSRVYPAGHTVWAVRAGEPDQVASFPLSELARRGPGLAARTSLFLAPARRARGKR